MIDHIFILTLQQRAERLKAITRQLDSFGMEYEPFYGVQGRKIRTLYPCDNLNNGCTASHLQMVQRAQIMGLNNCLILEDDVTLCDDFPDRIDELPDILPDDWDMVYFSGSHREKPQIISERLCKVSWTLTTHAYLLRNTMFDRVTKALPSLHQPVDCYYVEWQKEINAYLTNPPIAWQAGGYSDVQQREMYYPWLKEEVK